MKSMKPPITKEKPSMSPSKKRDSYHWLRAQNWQAVMHNPTTLPKDIREHLDKENIYTDFILKDTKDLQEVLFQEIKGRIQEDESSVPIPDGDYTYYTRFEKGAQYPIYCRKKCHKNHESLEEVLFDFDKMGKEHQYFSIGGIARSFNHRYMAYSLDKKGSEYYTIQFRDTEENHDLTDVLNNTNGNVVWAKGEKYVFYVTVNENHRPDKIWRHRMGTKQRDDILVYKEKDTGFFLDVSLSESEQYIFIVCHDHTTSETHMLPSHTPLQEFKVIVPRIEGMQYDVFHRGEFFYISTNVDGATDFKIVKAPVENPCLKNWHDYIAHKKGVLQVSMSVNNEYLIRMETVNALPRIIVKNFDTEAEETIKFNEQAYALGLSGALEFNKPIMRFSYCSPTTQNEVYDYNMLSQKRTLRKRQNIPSGHNPKDYESRRIFVTSHDGEKVPLTIIFKKGITLDGSNPAILYGYGSYGCSLSSTFSVSRLSLLDRGFVYALAHVRGGMDCGYDWYTQGKLKSKKNTFMDFLACGQALIDNKYTKLGSITAIGGSAGGLLMGAVVNMHPAMFKNIIALVPFVDVLNTMCDETLPLTPSEWKEWGNPKESKDMYTYIESYSPYDTIEKLHYPNIYVQAGLTDPRVTYWEPAKWVAKIRKYNQNITAKIVLRTHMKAGHSGASGRFDSLRETAEEFAFIIDNM